MNNLMKSRRETGEFNKLPNLLENFFEGEFPTLFPKTWSRNVPSVNISETENEYRIAVAAPGMSKEDFNLHVDGGTLVISAERKNEVNDETETYTRREYIYDNFSRTFSLPESVNLEGINASYKDGILAVVLPKTEAAKKNRPMEIKVS